MEILKLLTLNEVVAQTVTFLLLLFILRAFLWKRVLGILDERKKKIASEFKAIEDGKKDIERLKTDYENRIGAIEESARARIDEAVGEGNTISAKYIVVRRQKTTACTVLAMIARNELKISIGTAFNPKPDTIASRMSSPQILLLKRRERLMGRTSMAMMFKKNIRRGMTTEKARNPLGLSII